MAGKAKVVLGEAPESDSEDELNVSNGVAVPAITVSSKGQVIVGEAPESDEETIGKSASFESVSSAVSASSLTIGGIEKKKSTRQDVSLLTKKLCDRNASLANNIAELVSHTVLSANNELNTVDQSLLKCQVQVQEAEDLLKNLNANVNTLEKKLKILLSSDYIPDICVPEQA